MDPVRKPEGVMQWLDAVERHRANFRRFTVRNLAGVPHCDKVIAEELRRCGIPIFNADHSRNEVSSMIEGRLGKIVFERAWYYWRVNGCMVPLDVANELYSNPVGRTDIRVNGHCGCPPPEEGAETIDLHTGKRIISQSEVDKGSDISILSPGWWEERYSLDVGQARAKFVTSYHIDSELGLYIFADTMKRNGVYNE